MHISWARLASFCHLGFISDPLIVSKFHNETHDPKGQENKIYTIVKGRETLYRRHTVPVTSCSEVKSVLKMVSFGSKDCTKEQKLVILLCGKYAQALWADLFWTSTVNVLRVLHYLNTIISAVTLLISYTVCLSGYAKKNGAHAGPLDCGCSQKNNEGF